MRTIIRLVLALAMTLAAPSLATGQQSARAGVGGQVVLRPELDYFVSRYRAVDAPPQGGEEGAVGARLMWPLSTRASFGGYVVHSPDDQNLSSTWRYGAQADVRIVPLPLAGRVDPLVSLGVGASRIEEAPARAHELRVAEPRTYLSVAPGLGVRLHLTPGLGLRGDARRVLEFREGVRRNVELSGGLSIGV